MKKKKNNNRQGKKTRPVKNPESAGKAGSAEEMNSAGEKPAGTEAAGSAGTSAGGKPAAAEAVGAAGISAGGKPESAGTAGSAGTSAGGKPESAEAAGAAGKKKKKRKKKRNRVRTFVRVAYAMCLTAFAVFVLLDTFILPSNIILAVRGMSDLSDRGRVVVTESTYEDNHIMIRISTDRVENTTVYIADVQISDASLLKTGLAGDAFGRNLAEVTSAIAERNEAVFAVNGDYYGFRQKGYVLRNGYLYRSTANTKYPYGEDLVVWEDGSFEIVEEGAFTAQELADLGAQQIFSFGPALVNHGEVQVVEGEEVERAQITNPRTAIGIVEPLHYIMVVSDGRTRESRGLSLYSLAGLMQELGCTIAYNLDGGGSSTIWFNGKVLNKPTTYGKIFEERVISDIVYIGY